MVLKAPTCESSLTQKLFQAWKLLKFWNLEAHKVFCRSRRDIPHCQPARPSFSLLCENEHFSTLLPTLDINNEFFNYFCITTYFFHYTFGSLASSRMRTKRRVFLLLIHSTPSQGWREAGKKTRNLCSLISLNAPKIPLGFSNSTAFPHSTFASRVDFSYLSANSSPKSLAIAF